MNFVPLLVMYMAHKMTQAPAALPWPTPKDPPPRRARKRHKRAARAPAHDVGPQGQAQLPATPARPHKRHRRKPHVHIGPAVIHDKPHQDDAAAHADHPAEIPPPATDVESHQDVPLQLPDVYTVAQLQSILRGLGWTGPNRMGTAMSPDLTDGNFGPVTQGNWMRSANKRNLNPIMERVDGQHARVDPETYATLRNVARSKGANVAGRRRGVGGVFPIP